MLRKAALNAGIFFLYLVSLLPFWFLYVVADVIFLVLYYIIGYRRQVVKVNLANSFPERSEAERLKIERRYYRYMADLIVETIKMITVSERSLRKRMKPTNPELVEHYFKRHKSIIAAAGHYCNWEMAALAFGLLTTEKRIIVYKPLKNEVFDAMFNRVRARFGAMLVAMRQTLRTMVALKNQLTFSVLVSDQTPNMHEINYFTRFLNQPTAVFLGIEKLAKLIDAAVIFYRIDRVSRGYYTYTLVPLIDEPKQAAEHEITEAHVRYLEKLIQEKPQYWLWSHRRWKYMPEDLNK
ncbi:lauroyl acyltransferase [Mucilaginibacter sp. 14171R-50]|uniref:lysophospholipid acyltransferase family protein n=1 Tax=Mucilaginibacter sp. 14171R-50 TaxID=2703789 RepID=UPI00138D509B|nr:lysophospholipid acyltransferase family protein [Mucilaginibacter sp. 14171R-50]QHS57234.1 lauroyl acyltransferase [Mucilaginibacter sp. 14171R-50]